MSSNDFVKGACQHCAGRLEFPAAAINQTVPCPHCGKLTGLAAAISGNKTNHFQRKRLAIAMAVCLCALMPAAILVMHKTGRRGVSSVDAPVIPQSNAPTISATAPTPPPEPQPEAQTNDFAIMPYKLEKTPGSSLVYITGTVRNLSDQQRFGVKLEFSLLDTNDNPVGSATDYHSVLDPHADWHFRAMVMASKTTSARFSSIAEEK